MQMLPNIPDQLNASQRISIHFVLGQLTFTG
jgi:hypothetical protein